MKRVKFYRQAWLLSVTVWLCISPVSLSATDLWPQWRGPDRNGHVTADPWPEKLDSTRLKTTWHKEIGHGYAGPIVSKDRVFTVETLNKKQEIVRAFDRASGEQIWERAWEGAMKVPFFAANNGSWVRSTPALDGDFLYVAGMRDVLVCLKTGDGTVKWRVDFVEKFGTPLPDFGFVCSPLVLDNAVYVQAGAGTVKLDKETGEIQWRTMNDKGGMYGSAFSSPVFTTLGGLPQLVVQTRAELAGVDIKNGTILWRQSVPAYRGMNILTPVVLGDTIFTSSYRNASFTYRVDRNDSGFSVSEIWSDKKSQGYMSTPVVVDGKLYLHQQNRKFSCLDPASSKVLWTSKKPFGQYWSLVANDDTILALDQKGELLLIDANPEAFTLLDRRKITDQDTWAHVAVAGDQIFVRELNAITAYRWSEPDTVSSIQK